jgi:hypothetical protein
VLIGHHGDTLDALQYLANLASARKNINSERDKSRVTIDIEGYRAKREETLRALARRMAAKAIRNNRSVMLEPMSAYERRIIHSEIQGIEGVSTNSIGSDNNRKIVIFLTDKKPSGIFEEEKNERGEELTEVVEAIEEATEVTEVAVTEETIENHYSIRLLSADYPGLYYLVSFFKYNGRCFLRDSRIGKTVYSPYEVNVRMIGGAIGEESNESGSEL